MADKPADGAEPIPPTPPSGAMPEPKAAGVIANPAEPAAPTKAPPPVDNSSLVGVGAGPGAKTLYHPVHGAVVVKDANEEASLSPRTDYFDTPGEADMHRTATEAWTTHAFNIAEKLLGHAEAGHQVVRNSVQADQSIRAGTPEPL